MTNLCQPLRCLNLNTLKLSSRFSTTLGGIFIFYVSLWILSGLDASGKWLMAVGVPLLILSWFRFAVHLVLITALMVSRRDYALFKSKAAGFQWLRGLTMVAATLLIFKSLSYLPQAETMAIVFMAPLIMLALAPWLLGESQRVSRWIAAGVGFVGVLIVIRPGSGLDPIGVALALTATFVVALQHICTRRLAVDHPFTTLVWSGMIGTGFLSVLLVWPGVTIAPLFELLGPKDWLILMSTGILGSVGHLLQIQAYRLAPASVIAPFIYLQITAATTVGWLVWGHFPDPVTWLGIGIICGSGLAIGFYEWRTRNRQTVVAGNN
jgi:drug/metabolite transporter (DMT)-like permease